MISKRLAALALALSLAGPGSAQPNVLPPGEAGQGFQLLFDGTRESFADNFVTYAKGDPAGDPLPAGWRVDSADSSMGRPNPVGPIRSRKTYGDFDLRFDFRTDGGGGLWYRASLAHDGGWQSGVECALSDYPGGNKDGPGAAYDLYPPRPNTYHPFNTGRWNSVRIVAVGDSVEHWMNGAKVVGYRTHSQGFWDAYAASKWYAAKTLTYEVPGNQARGYIREGYLGIGGLWGGNFRLRNIRVAPITDGVSTRPPARSAGASRLVPDLRNGRLLFRGPAGSPVSTDGRRSAAPAAFPAR